MDGGHFFDLDPESAQGTEPVYSVVLVSQAEPGKSKGLPLGAFEVKTRWYSLSNTQNLTQSAGEVLQSLENLAQGVWTESAEDISRIFTRTNGTEAQKSAKVRKMMQERIADRMAAVYKQVAEISEVTVSVLSQEEAEALKAKGYRPVTLDCTEYGYV
jgi:hypothetical protein